MENTINEEKRTCQNCVMWGKPEKGDLGTCCRITSVDGMVLAKGKGGAKTLPTFGCNEFVSRPEATPLVLEGPLQVFYHEGWTIGESEVLSAIWAKWEDTYTESDSPHGKFRITIERLE